MLSGNLNRILWVAIVLAIVVFGLKAQDNFISYFASVGTLDVTPPEADGTLRLDWRGKVKAPMARKISEAYDQYETTTRKVVLTLSSPGGTLSEGRDVIRVLRRIASARDLETRVDSGRMCASMCVPVYLQGEERSAAASARFMFHQVSFRDFYEGTDERVPASAKETATERLFNLYFTPAGVPERWLSTIKAATAGGHDVWMSGAELAADGSNIVQQID